MSHATRRPILSQQEGHFLGGTFWYKGVSRCVLPVGRFTGACPAAPSHRRTKHPLPAQPCRPRSQPPGEGGGRPCPQPALPREQGSAGSAAGPAAPREAWVKGARAELGQNSFFSPGHQHNSDTSTERPKLLSQSPAPGKGGPPRQLAATLPSRPTPCELIETSSPVSWACRCNTSPAPLVRPPPPKKKYGRCGQHTVPRAHAGREGAERRFPQ